MAAPRTSIPLWRMGVWAALKPIESVTIPETGAEDLVDLIGRLKRFAGGDGERGEFSASQGDILRLIRLHESAAPYWSEYPIPEDSEEADTLDLVRFVLAENAEAVAEGERQLRELGESLHGYVAHLDVIQSDPSWSPPAFTFKRRPRARARRRSTTTTESAAARWVQDPTGRHKLRYSDGSAWTAHVSDDGHPLTTVSERVLARAIPSGTRDRVVPLEKVLPPVWWRVVLPPAWVLPRWSSGFVCGGIEPFVHHVILEGYGVREDPPGDGRRE